jgi:peptidoglycan/LPS O-acetylase OafA/YrhL
VGKIYDIEVLRAVAILFTLYQHFTAVAPAHNWAIPFFAFWSGVDLFLVISGFVISRGLLKSSMDWTVLASFWKRRAWRILPSAWVWLAISVVLVAILGKDAVGPTLRDAAAALLFIANFNLHLCGSGQYVCGEAPQYWSLSLEEQFYFILPIVLFLPRKWFLFVLSALVAAQMVWLRTPGFSIENMVKSDALALGVLLSMFSQTITYHKIEPVMLRHFWLRPIFSVALIAALAWAASQPFARSLSVVTVISAVMVWVASYNKSYFMGESPVKAALVFVGSRSYSLYLVHMPMFMLTREMFVQFSPDSNVLIRCAVALVFTAVLSDMNFRFVESRFRYLGTRIVPQPVPSITAYSEA